MRRAIVVLLVGALSCARHGRLGGLHVEAGADGVGALVKVNGRVVGRLRESWWVTTSSLDSLGGKGSTTVSGVTPRRDSTLASALDAEVPSGKKCQLVFTRMDGVLVSTTCDLGDSTVAYVSFSERAVTLRASKRAMGIAGADTPDSGDGYHDEK